MTRLEILDIIYGVNFLALMKGKNEMKCLTPECKRDAKSRGLCFSCYQSARNKVKNKKVTWDELVENGMVNKAGHRGRSGGNFETFFKKNFPNFKVAEVAKQQTRDGRSE